MKKTYIQPQMTTVVTHHEQLICASLGSGSLPNANFGDAETVDYTSADVKANDNYWGETIW